MDDGLCFARGFFEEFDAERAETGGMKILEIRRAGLRGGVEERVAAADIGPQGVLHANTVAEVDAVFLAGSAAIRVVGPIGKECRKDAVLHMKHGHVVVQGEFEPLRRCVAEKGEDLGDIEVVGDRESGEASTHEDGGGDRIRDVQ